jgi:hypothetical protein
VRNKTPERKNNGRKTVSRLACTYVCGNWNGDMMFSWLEKVFCILVMYVAFIPLANIPAASIDLNFE